MQPSLGKLSAYKMFSWRDRSESSIEQTVSAFLELGEAIATRWVQTAKGVLLLRIMPDNSESGAIYVFDRQREQWYMRSFEGCEDSSLRRSSTARFPSTTCSAWLSSPACCSLNSSRPKVQSSAWSASGRTHGHSAHSPAPAVSMNAPKFVKIVVAPRSKAA